MASPDALKGSPNPLNEILKMADVQMPETRELWGGMRFHTEYNWMVDPMTWCLLPVAYLVTVFMLKKFMECHSYNLDGFVLKQIMRLYNLAQVVGCSWMIYLFLPDFFKADDVFGWYSDFTAQAEFAMLMHYISKAFDYLDTVFMILRRRERQLTFLHVFHHATVLSIWGSLLHASHGGSTAGFAAMLNSFVHVVMYSHYFVTSFGIRNPFKKYITMVQLAQFAIDFVHAISILSGFGNYPKQLAAVQFVYQIFMLTLFGQFYVKSYSKPAKSSTKPSKKKSKKEQ